MTYRPGKDRDEDLLRPLLLATIAAGVLALGLLQYSADAFAIMDVPGRVLVDRGVRIGFFAFLGCATGLIVATIAGASRFPRVATAFNLFGAASFIVGAFLSGGMIGGALRRLAPETHVALPATGLFLLFNMTAVVALAVASATSVYRARRVGSAPPAAVSPRGDGSPGASEGV